MTKKYEIISWDFVKQQNFTGQYFVDLYDSTLIEWGVIKRIDFSDTPTPHGNLWIDGVKYTGHTKECPRDPENAPFNEVGNITERSTGILMVGVHDYIPPRRKLGAEIIVLASGGDKTVFILPKTVMFP